MSASLLTLLCDVRCVQKQGVSAIHQRQRDRLADLVTFARVHSPLYRDVYQGLPERVEMSSVLPVTNKNLLMSRFDEWGTDPAVTLEKARLHVENSALIGENFVGRYTIATTSGTSGTRGIFVMDDRNLRVATALAQRALGSWLAGSDVFKIVLHRGRMSMVMATGGHFASTVAATRLRRQRTRAVQILSVGTPMGELVALLNQFQPAIVAPYASMASLLCNEQEAGRLHIHPVLIALAAEGLPGTEYQRIARVFDTKVGNSYAATECPFLSYSCKAGWLHVNSDWVVLEPVDAHYQPVVPGQISHTVLVSNLANRVQPIIRYDLGDSVLQRPDPCPCGNPLPAILVQGRTADILTFTTTRGEVVTLPPLAFTTLMERVAGIDLFQIVQMAPTHLRVQLRVAPGIETERVWNEVHYHITHLLARHHLGHIRVERAAAPPQLSPGGKYRMIIPFREGKSL